MTVARTRRPRHAAEPRLQEIAENVYAYLQPDGGWCLSNSGVLLDGAGVTLVDTAATEARTRALRTAVRSLSAGPVRTVVNTHFHGDHSFGNGVFAPDATIVAHERARVEMAEAGTGLRLLWPDVNWGDVPVTLPTLTIADRATLHLDDRPVEVFHLGPAHTTGDLFVWLPGPRVLFAGDVTFSGGTPFVLMGSVSGSLRTIERLRALEPAAVVSGHGPVTGPEVFDETESYLRWLQRLARDGHAAGIGPLEAAHAADLGPFADLLDTERLVGNLHRAYAEQVGAAPGARLDVLAAFAEMVEFNGGRTPVCLA